MNEKEIIKKELKEKRIRLSELEKRASATGERLRLLTKKREVAWAATVEAEDALQLATQELLVEIDQLYKTSREKNDFFMAKYAIKTKQITESITLEKEFIKECELLKNEGKTDSEKNHWQLCQKAHENRLRLYKEEQLRLDLYKERSQESLFEIEQEALLRVDQHKIQTEKILLRKSNLESAKRQLNAAEGLLDEARKTLDKIVEEYNRTEAESKRLQHELTKQQPVEVIDLN